MTTIKVKVVELYELQAQLGGVKITQKIEDKDVVTLEYKGILNEKGVTEGTKRAVLKDLRVINTEIETLNKQRQEIAAYAEEGKTPEELAEIIKAKDAELISQDVEIDIELIDFSKIQDLVFSMDYDFTYNKLFK